MDTKRRTSRRGGTVELVLTMVGLCVLGGSMLLRNPITRSPRPNTTATATEPSSVTSADVLVVLPPEHEAELLADWSYAQAWINAVEQEVGPVRLSDADQLTRSVMDPCAWIIVPHEASGLLDPTQTQFLLNWVEDGGVLILEQPEGPWVGLVGQDFRSVATSEPGIFDITSFDGSLMRHELREDIEEVDIPTTLSPYQPDGLARGRDYQVLMEINGLPALISRDLGRGRIILATFHVGRALALIQQGTPLDNFEIPPFEGVPEDGTLTHVAALSTDDLSTGFATIPAADLLERNILYLADAHRPVGRLWGYPGGSRGALVVTHSEGGFGPRSMFMPEWEHANDVRATIFASATTVSPEVLARISRIDSDVEFQWYPTGHPMTPAMTWGWGGFQPIERPMSLDEQLESINRGLVPYGPVVAGRAESGFWPSNYFEGFRNLQALGLELDMSYSPAPAWTVDPETHEQHLGYVFGTGLPFRPIDRNGNLFDFYELPVTLTDQSRGYSIQNLRQLMVRASDRYHTTIVADWRPDTMSVRPSFDSLEGWREAFELAESQELWVATAADYADFIRRRQASLMDSTFAAEERRLTMDVRLVPPDPAGDDALSLTPSIAFPARYNGRPAERVVVDTESIDVEQLALSGDRYLHILPLTAGEHRVEVIYAGPFDLARPDSP